MGDILSEEIQQTIANNQFIDILKKMSIDELKDLKSDTIKAKDFWDREVSSREQYIKNMKKARDKSLDSLERFKGWAFSEYASKTLNKSGFFIDNERVIAEDIHKSLFDKNVMLVC